MLGDGLPTIDCVEARVSMEANVNKLIRVMRIMEFSEEHGATFGRSLACLVGPMSKSFDEVSFVQRGVARLLVWYDVKIGFLDLMIV